MDTARIAALLEPFLKPALSSTQLAQISTYIDLLLRWSTRINLTAIRDPEEIVTRHFGESLFLASHLFPASVERTLLSASAVSTQESDAPLVAPFAMSGKLAPTTASPRHRLRRRIPRTAPEDLDPTNPPDPDRIQSQKSRLPP